MEAHLSQGLPTATAQHDCRNVQAHVLCECSVTSGWAGHPCQGCEKVCWHTWQACQGPAPSGACLLCACCPGARPCSGQHFAGWKASCRAPGGAGACSASCTVCLSTSRHSAAPQVKLSRQHAEGWHDSGVHSLGNNAAGLLTTHYSSWHRTCLSMLLALRCIFVVGPAGICMLPAHAERLSWPLGGECQCHVHAVASAAMHASESSQRQLKCISPQMPAEDRPHLAECQGHGP